MKFQNPNIHGFKIWQASASVTNGWTNQQTNNDKPICPTNVFKVGGIKVKALALMFLRYFADKVKMPKVTKGIKL